MNKTTAMLVLGTTLVGFVGLAASHEMPYAQAQPGKPNPSTGVAMSMVDCGTGNHPVLNLSIGGVCFGSLPEDGWNENCSCDPCEDPVQGLLGCPGLPPGAQHLTDAPTATLDIGDATFSLVPAFYCQNLNHEVDNVCGGNLTGAPETEPGGNPSPICQGIHKEGDGACAYRSEPYVAFCDTITIFRGLDGPAPAGSRRTAGTYPDDVGSGNWADSPNWDIDENVFIFLSAPLNGNGVFGNACGPTTTGWATIGSVSHS